MFASPVWLASTTAIAAVASADVTDNLIESAKSSARIETARMVSTTCKNLRDTLDWLSTGLIYLNPISRGAL